MELSLNRELYQSSTEDDIMRQIVICRHCGKPEYYGEMRWLNGRQQCRTCYKHHYEDVNKTLYTWEDLDGERPTMDEYLLQESARNIN